MKLAIILIFLSFSSFASCSKNLNDFLEIAKQTKMSFKLAQKYPELKYLLRDPQGFTDEVRLRFDLQKMKDPSKPLEFDYSEMGVPLLRDMISMMNKAIGDVEAKKLGIIERIFQKEKAIENKEIRIRFMKELRDLMDEKVALNYVSYKDAIDLSYYHSRIVSYKGETKEPYYNQIASRIFRKGIGANDAFTLKEEYRLFLARKERNTIGGNEFFSRSPMFGGYVEAREHYIGLLDDPDNINVIILPHAGDLEEDVLLWLNVYDVRLIGVTDQNIEADASVMSSAAFWFHDLSHDMLIRRKHDDYFSKLTSNQKEMIKSRMETWRIQVDEMISNVKDEQLKRALLFVDWVTHHDVGYPQVPSIYRAPKAPAFAQQIYIGMLMTGQGRDLGKTPWRSIQGAYEHLQKFWFQFYEEEMSITNGFNFPIENYKKGVELVNP